MKSFPAYRQRLFTGGRKLSEFADIHDDKRIGPGIEGRDSDVEPILKFKHLQEEDVTITVIYE